MASQSLVPHRRLHVGEIEDRLFFVRGKIAERLATREADRFCQRRQALSQFRTEPAGGASDQDTFVMGHRLLHLCDGSVDPRDRFGQHLFAGRGRDTEIG